MREGWIENEESAEDRTKKDEERKGETLKVKKGSIYVGTPF